MHREHKPISAHSKNKNILYKRPVNALPTRGQTQARRHESSLQIEEILLKDSNNTKHERHRNNNIKIAEINHGAVSYNVFGVTLTTSCLLQERG